EVRNGIWIIGASSQLADFDFGASYYNRLVRNFVPAFIFGHDLKEGLQMAASGESDATWRAFSFGRASYSYPFGPAVAFRQFWYLGAFAFVAIGMWVAYLWKRSIKGSLIARVTYIAILPGAVTAMLQDQGLIL